MITRLVKDIPPLPVTYSPAMETQKYPNHLRDYRERLDLTQTQLAEMVGTSVQNISRLERGDRQLSRKWAERIAPHLSAKPEDLIFRPASDSMEDSVPISPGRVPYGGRVNAGYFLTIDEFNQDLGDHLVPASVPRHPGYPQLPQTAWKVIGDSMDQAGFIEGMWAVAAPYLDYIDKIGELDNGNYVIVERRRFGGGEIERTVKEVQFARRGMRLVPRSSNPDYKEFFIDLDDGADNDVEEVRIIAVVLWVGLDVDPRSRRSGA